jgi:tetratricopeptide (TPR) repeat protein
MSVPRSKSSARAFVAALSLLLTLYGREALSQGSEPASLPSPTPPSKTESPPPPPSESRPAPAPSEEEPDECLADDKCKELYDTARTQSESGQYDAALINYQNAYARRQVSWLLISIGRMQQKLQRFQPAIANYKRFLGLPTEVTEEILRTRAQTYLKQAQQQWEEQKRLLAPQAPVEREKTPVYKKWSNKKNRVSDGVGCWNSRVWRAA